MFICFDNQFLVSLTISMKKGTYGIDKNCLYSDTALHICKDTCLVDISNLRTPLNIFFDVQFTKLEEDQRFRLPMQKVAEKVLKQVTCYREKGFI